MSSDSTIELVASGHVDNIGLDLLRQATDAAVSNGGEWYTPGQMLQLLGEFVGRPALMVDAAFIGMATPELIATLLARAGSVEVYKQAIRNVCLDKANRDLGAVAIGYAIQSEYERLDGNPEEAGEPADQAQPGDAFMGISPQGAELIVKAISSHSAVVSYIVHGRADLALAESMTWVKGFAEAADQLRDEPEASR